MPEPRIETFGAVDLKDALIVTAFPGAGSASSIAAQYLLRHLDLPLVGHVQVPALSAVSAVQDGRVTSAIRVYGGEVACKLEKGCPRIFLVTTELVPPPQVALGMAEAVLGWAAKGGAHLVLALEAVVRSEDDDTPDVFCASVEPKVLKELKKAGIPPMSRALIGGITAHLLLLAKQHKLRSGAVMVEADREMPDGRAAAALIGALDRILPDVSVDARPLLDEAMKLEKEIRNLRNAANEVQQPHPHQFI
jgi:uncharacterized protein